MGGFYLNQPDPFFTDIEAAVSKHRGKRYQASPTDWATMEAWKERGVPVHLITRSVGIVADRAERSITSLTFIKEEVESQFNEWAKSQVGRSYDTQTHPA